MKKKNTPKTSEELNVDNTLDETTLDATADTDYTSDADPDFDRVLQEFLDSLKDNEDDLDDPDSECSAESDLSDLSDPSDLSDTDDDTDLYDRYPYDDDDTDLDEDKYEICAPQRLPSLKLQGASITWSGNRFADLVLNIQYEPCGLTKIQLYADCWAAETYTSIARCEAATSHRFNFATKNISPWLDGEYYFWLYIDHKPWYRIVVNIANAKAKVTALQQLKRQPQLSTLAMLSTNDPRDYDNRVEFYGMPGNVSLKKWLAEQCQMRALHQHRWEHLKMHSLNMHHVYVFYGECNEENESIMRMVSEVLNDASFSVLDCSRLRTTHEQPMSYDSDKLDVSSSVSCYAATTLLTNVSSLAQSDMAAQCIELKKRIREFCSDANIFILGTKGEVAQMLEFLPWMRDIILPQHYIELTPMSRQDLTRQIVKTLSVLDLKCDEKILSAITAAVARVTNVAAWNCFKIKSWLATNVVPNYVKRICKENSTLINFNSLSRRKLQRISLSDFDFSSLIGTAEGFDQCMHELSTLVGLGELKGSFADMFRLARFHQERNKLGFSVEKESRYHCIFTGNPGTGKTTVAKLMGKIFKGLGIISKGGVIVADRKRLVGQYIGETEYNIRMVLKEAVGNVLFIDEAYTLVGDPNDKRDFGPKALEALLTILAQPNPDMVIIFAGYEREMQNLFSINTGIEGRFPLKFKFPDYTVDELVQIGHNLFSQKGYILTPEAEAEFVSVVGKAVAAKTRTFANARWVGDLISVGIEVAMASRVTTLGHAQDKDYTLIQPQDVRDGYHRLCPQQAPKRALGFK